MNALLKEVRQNPLLWLLAFVPVVLVAAKLKPEAHTLLFVLSVLGIAIRNKSMKPARTANLLARKSVMH